MLFIRLFVSALPGDVAWPQILLPRWPKSVVVLMDNDMFLTDVFSVKRYLRGYVRLPHHP